MRQFRLDTQVIVVGAGPVGLMLAGELRLGGAQVTVLERRSSPNTESRASTVHARTMEIFDQRGLLERFGRPANQRVGHFGGIPLDLGALPSRYPGQWKIAQTEVERVLADWATSLGADIRRGHEVVGWRSAAHGLQVQVAGPQRSSELGCEYLVGCDGEQSVVRALAGIPLRGKPASRELFRADVVNVELAERRFERLPGGLAIAGRLPSGATRVMVAEFAPPRPRTAPVSFAEIAKTWYRVTGDDISDATPLWVNAFDNASQQAERYRHGRVLLAGDAAHLQMPSGGQAINLGLQDAANLGWKLAAEVAGTAPDGLLDSYARERHQVGRQVLDNIEAQSLLLLSDRDIEPARAVLAELIGKPEVRDLLAGKISGLDVRYGEDDQPLVGSRLPELVLDAGRGRSVTELLRPGHGLLLSFAGGQSRLASLRDWTLGCAQQLDLVCSADRDDRWPELQAMLLRPDGYVAWAGDEQADPRPALRQWFGAPGRLRRTTS